MKAIGVLGNVGSWENAYKVWTSPVSGSWLTNSSRVLSACSVSYYANRKRSLYVWWLDNYNLSRNKVDNDMQIFSTHINFWLVINDALQVSGALDKAALKLLLNNNIPWILGVMNSFQITLEREKYFLKVAIRQDILKWNNRFLLLKNSSKLRCSDWLSR